MTSKKTKLLKPEGAWTAEVKAFFDLNEPVALPTETVYGLAAPASNVKAVARIYEIKERPSFNPLILHVKENWDLSQWAELGSLEKKLIEKFWPGPLSVLLQKKNVSDLVTAGSSKVVMRAPQHKVFRETLDFIKEPLVAPSANSSTKLSPTTAIAIVEDLSSKGLVAVVDGGQSEFGIESTIVEVRGEELLILREGALSKEDFEKEGFRVADKKLQASAVTPGSQQKHYSPSIPLLFFEDEKLWMSSPPKLGVLWVKILKSDSVDVLPSGEKVFCLAEDNDFKTAAHHLFEFLRDSQKKYKELRVLKTQNYSLGRAINDRLKRAGQT